MAGQLNNMALRTHVSRGHQLGTLKGTTILALCQTGVAARQSLGAWAIALVCGCRLTALGLESAKSSS